MSRRGFPRARGLAVLLLAVGATLPAQTIDPKVQFVQALAQFSLALDGSYGDEGSAARASLAAMASTLDRWDGTIERAERGVAAEAARTEAAAAGMHAALAAAYLDRGRYGDAVRELTAAIQLDPARASFHRARALLYAQALAQLEPATLDFQRAAELDPGNPFHWYELGQHLVRRGRADEARAALAKSVAILQTSAAPDGTAPTEPPLTRIGLVEERSNVEPFFPPALYAAGYERLQAGDLRGALAAFAAALSRDPLTARPIDGLEPMGRAAAALRDGSIEAAIAQLRLAIEREPDRAEAHRVLGAALARDEQYGPAVEELRTAARLAPDDERVRLALGDVLAGAGRVEEAERALQEAAAAFPRGGAAHYRLGRLYQRQGRYEDAVRELARALEAGPLVGANRIHQQIGALHAAQHNLEAAAGAYLQRALLTPTDPDAHDDLGRVYSQLGRDEEALAEFFVSLALAPRQASSNVGIAQVYLRQGRHAAAAEAARRALSVDTENAQARYALGTALIRLGRTGEGEKELREFERLQAEAASAHARDFELGRLRREASEASARGEHAAAVALLRTALELAPDEAVSYLNLGLALLYAGQPAEAVERLKSAIALGGPLEAHLHLAQAYAALGRDEDGRRELAVYDELRRAAPRR